MLWLDAHTDYDTPATSTYSFLGCMSLAGATGAWDAGLGDALAPERVVLVGTRARPGDFDAAAQAAAAASAMTLVPIADGTAAAVLDALGDAPVYVHLDPDVLDPSVNPVPYARPGGLPLDALIDAAGRRRRARAGARIGADRVPQRRRPGAPPRAGRRPGPGRDRGARVS